VSTMTRLWMFNNAAAWPRWDGRVCRTRELACVWSPARSNPRRRDDNQWCPNKSRNEQSDIQMVCGEYIKRTSIWNWYLLFHRISTTIINLNISVLRSGCEYFDKIVRDFLHLFKSQRRLAFAQKKPET